MTFSQGTRPTVNLSLHISASSPTAALPKSVQIRRLAIGHADDTTGVRFAGVSYETANALPVGKDTYTTSVVSKGAVQVGIQSTEVVLLTFKF